ncbi:MAG: hypothetical protein R3C10_01900 [Pirellulales bacterium]
MPRLGNERDEALGQAQASSDRHVELETALQQQATELEAAQQQLDTLGAEADSLRSQLAAQASAVDQDAAAQVRIEELELRVAELTDQLAQSRTEVASAQEAVTTAAVDRETFVQTQQNLASELESTREELRRVRQQLDETVADGASRTEAESEQLADLRGRYDLALADVRDRKKEAERLQKELKQLKMANANAGVNVSSGELDWEAQKRKLLASLDSEFDAGDAAHQETRLSIESTIEQTDMVVAAKEREIEELKRLLDDQSSNIGQVAVGANALAELLDTDEIIQRERENLTALQCQWEDKLRKAEIDLSMERAKIARERTEIEEKLRTIERQQAEMAAARPQRQDVKPGERPSRSSKWFNALGLSGSDDE